MTLILTTLGVVLIVLALQDIFHTLFHPARHGNVADWIARLGRVSDLVHRCHVIPSSARGERCTEALHQLCDLCGRSPRPRRYKFFRCEETSRAARVVEPPAC